MIEIEDIRQGVVTDAPAIRELTRTAYAKWVPVIGREPKPMTVDYAEALQKHRFDLLFMQGELVALIETIPQIDHLIIENLAVSPFFQGRGFGRKLIAHAEEISVASGFSVTKLYTNKLFADDLQLYSKLGYQVDYEEAFKGGTLVHMSKTVQ